MEHIDAPGGGPRLHMPQRRGVRGSLLRHPVFVFKSKANTRRGVTLISPVRPPFADLARRTARWQVSRVDDPDDANASGMIE